MNYKLKALQEKYKITDEDMEIAGLAGKDLLCSRITKEEKKLLDEECKTRNLTYTAFILKQMDIKNIDVKGVRLLRGEYVKNQLTVPIRISVTKDYGKEVKLECRKKHITVSALLRHSLRKALIND